MNHKINKNNVVTDCCNADSHYPLERMTKSKLIEFAKELRYKIYTQELAHAEHLREKNDQIVSLSKKEADALMSANEYKVMYESVKRNNCRIGISITAYMAAKFPDTEQESFLHYLKMFCEES